MSKPRILIASPVRQKPAILAQFLASIKRLRSTGLDLACAFIDDNVDPESSRLLAEFDFPGECVVTRVDSSDKGSEYRQDEVTHHWKEDLIWKVAGFKDLLIELALDTGMDYLFLADSDLVLSPYTLEHLVGCDKEVVSEVFWTSWQPGQLQLPQVWARGEYELARRRREEQLTEAEVHVRTLEFIRHAYQPGLRQVGGLGACTLISRSALAKGARFAEIDNLTYWGEDRHFCVRARSLGIELWADTTHPPLHLYRESELARVNDYIRWAERDRWAQPHITLSMVVRNESGRYLERALMQHRDAIDAAVIIDDASEDDTVQIVQRCLQGVPLKLVRNSQVKFRNEVELRSQQWNETVTTHPDWILNLDADEILEDGCAHRLRALAEQTRYRYVGFALYDMWDDRHYRDDSHWNAHQRTWGFMYRYTPFYNYAWQHTAQHCGRYPRNLDFFELAHCDLKVQHMGWSRETDRIAKWKRYMELDPQGRFGSMAQYQSILDPAPRLVPFGQQA
ncbi:MAG: glycosyltransferase family 2 protein [Rubrivivax sp.]